MKINLKTNISKDHGDDIEVIVNASEYTKDVEDLIKLINTVNKSEISTILGKNGNEVSILDISDIMYFYSEEQNNYCKTQKGTFKINEKLYELEEKLPKANFVRISNSSIINIKYVQCFDVGIVGSILVKFVDNSTQNVSRRRVSQVMKFLKERG